MIRALSIALSVVVLFSASAEKMDLSTTNLVIEKLTKSIKGQSDRQSKDIQLRLADLYSERARLSNLRQHENRNQCADCKNPKADRRKALSLYYKLFDRFDSPTQERMIQQISHLSLAVNQLRPADRLYQKILASRKYSKFVKARVMLSLAEQAFFKGEYKKALRLYDSAMARHKKLKKPLVLYRVAWCHFNLGRITTAQAILRNIANGLVGSGEHLVFLEDLTRDYALFMSRKPISTRELNKLSSISPETTKKANLIYLAGELARHGKSKSFMQVYTYIDQHYPLTELERADYQLKAAQSAYAIGHRKSAANYYVQSLKQSKGLRCKKSEQRACDKLKREQRDFLLTWNKEEKLNPSASLQASYLAFADSYPKDIQAGYWAAQVAHQRGDFVTAHAAYHKVSKESRKQDGPLAKKLFDQSLKAEINIAEATGNQKIKEQTYANYLAVRPRGKHAIESQYQLAYLNYEKKRYEKAQKQFDKLSRITLQGLSSTDRSLIKKSADLNLDCLAIAKEDRAIIAASVAYSKKWPKHRTSFQKVRRRATLNYATKILKDKKSDRDELRSALIELRSLSFRLVAEKEQITLLTTQALIAERIRDFRELKRSSRKILSYKIATRSDKEFALRQLIWVAEVHLQFKTAYRLSQQAGRGKLSPSSHILRLALLADLANLDPIKHYKEYLRKYPRSHQANQVRARIVLKSRQPWKKLKSFEKELLRSPKLFADLTLEVFARKKEIRKAEALLKIRKFRRSASAQILQRHVDYYHYFNLTESVRKHRLKSKSDTQLRSSLKQRLALITNLESQVRRAVVRKEWGLQTIALTSLGKEYGRLERDILRLPVPRGLSKAERQRYRQALITEAAPYKKKSLEISKRLEKQWKSASYVDYIARTKERSPSPLNRLWAAEGRYLGAVAPNWKKGRLKRIASLPKTNSRQIVKAKVAIQHDPFNRSKIEELKKLVDDSGRPSMSTFLSARLADLKKEQRR